MKVAELLRDPLYRYEARRYWTARRYAGAAVLLLGWWGVLGWVYFEELRDLATEADPEEMVGMVAWFSLICRMPLSFLAATGAALSVVPDRVSGQLEQFVLTPIDPWRFCLARWAGRLRGLFPFWVCMGAALLVVLLSLPAARTVSGAVLLVLLLAAQVDLAMMLMVDAALGMRFSCASRSTTEALVRTYLTAFLGVPFFMTMGVLAIFLLLVTVAAFLFDISYSAHVGITMCLAVLVIRLALGAVVLWGVLHDMRRAVEKAFFRPGEA